MKPAEEGLSGSLANGFSTPVTPKSTNLALTSLALTEYTASPTPPSERGEPAFPGLPRGYGVPDAFLLPNGYPDVSAQLLSGDAHETGDCRAEYADAPAER